MDFQGSALNGFRAEPWPSFPSAFQEELSQLLHWRRDVRRFRADPLPDGLLMQLLELAHTAPSVGLSQPWRFVTVDDPRRRAAIRASHEACNAAAALAQPVEYVRLKLAGLDEAPCHVAVFADPDPGQGSGLGRATMPETAAYSAVIAVHTLWLAARAAGIGLGWVSILDPAAVAAALEVPPDWRFIGYLCLGYPREVSDSPELERAGWEQRGPLRARLLRR